MLVCLLHWMHSEGDFFVKLFSCSFHSFYLGLGVGGEGSSRADVLGGEAVGLWCTLVINAGNCDEG